MQEFFEEKIENRFMKKPALFTWRRVWLMVGILFLLAVILSVGLVTQAKIYEDKVSPGLYIGEVAIGGMSRENLKSFLHSMNDKLISDGLHFSFDYKGEGKDFLLQPVIVTEDSAIELMYIDVDKEVERIINYKKESGLLLRAIDLGRMRFFKSPLKLGNIVIDEGKLVYEISEKLKKYAVEPANASVKINNLSPLEYEIVSSSVGNVYLYNDAVAKLKTVWSKLEMPDVKIENKEVLPSVLESDVENIVNRLENVFNEGNISLAYKNPETKRSYEWTIETNRIAEWLEVQKIAEGNLAFGLKKDLVFDYLESLIGPKINVEARDAKFEINEEGTITEFQSSRSGVNLDVERIKSGDS